MAFRGIPLALDHDVTPDDRVGPQFDIPIYRLEDLEEDSETGTIVPLYHEATGFNETPVNDSERQGAVRTEDTLA